MKARDTFRRLGWGSQGRPRRHPLIAGILVLVLLAQFGCASSGSGKRSALDILPPPPGEAVHKVAVTSGRFAPEFDIIDWNLPPSFKMQLLVAPFLPFGLFLFPFILAIGSAIEAIGSAIEDKDEQAKRSARIAEWVAKMKQREATIREMVAAQKIQDDLRDRMVAIGLAKTPHAFTGLTDQGPSAPSEQPDYRLLSQEGIQAVLEVVIERVMLDGIDDIPDPEFRLVMSINTRLVRTVDNLELYATIRTYHGKNWQTKEEWFDDPEDLRDELNRAYREIAEKTVEEIFPRTESN